MSENKIKSEKAKQALIVVHRDSQIGIEHDNFHLPNSVFEAIEIAETEAEERHAKELHELKDKAIESFKDIMFDVMMESRDGKFIPEDYCLTNFTTHLNK